VESYLTQFYFDRTHSKLARARRRSSNGLQPAEAFVIASRLSFLKRVKAISTAVGAILKAPANSGLVGAIN